MVGSVDNSVVQSAELHQLGSSAVFAPMSLHRHWLRSRPTHSLESDCNAQSPGVLEKLVPGPGMDYST